MGKNTEQIDRFKQAMGNYPTGVTVVTAFDDNNKPMGLTVTSFASVSLDPLLILWSINDGAGSYNDFLHSEKFAVNILTSDHAVLCTLFSICV